MPRFMVKLLLDSASAIEAKRAKMNTFKESRQVMQQF